MNRGYYDIMGDLFRVTGSLGLLILLVQGTSEFPGIKEVCGLFIFCMIIAFRIWSPNHDDYIEKVDLFPFLINSWFAPMVFLVKCEDCGGVIIGRIVFIIFSIFCLIDLIKFYSSHFSIREGRLTFG